MNNGNTRKRTYARLSFIFLLLAAGLSLVNIWTSQYQRTTIIMSTWFKNPITGALEPTAPDATETKDIDIFPHLQIWETVVVIILLAMLFKMKSLG